jgi:hypothetical protein
MLHNIENEADGLLDEDQDPYAGSKRLTYWTRDSVVIVM